MVKESWIPSGTFVFDSSRGTRVRKGDARSNKPTVKKDNRRESVEVRRDNEIVYPHQKEEEEEEEEDKVNAFVCALDRSSDHPLSFLHPTRIPPLLNNKREDLPPSGSRDGT